MKIQDVHAVQILDSRGNPTVKAFVKFQNGLVGSAAVPSGASTGTYEVLELRDGDNKKYMGLGVAKAVANVNNIIAQKLKGVSIEMLEEIDKKMLKIDGTENKSALGANSILAVSLAATRALSQFKGTPLWQTINKYYFPDIKPTFPRIMVNIINGGAHAGWNFDIQEFMIVPCTRKPHKSARTASEIFHALRAILKKEGFSTLVGDEGGFSPALSSDAQAFIYLERAIRKAGFDKAEVDLAIDAAASEFYTDDRYVLKKLNKRLSTDELIEYYLKLKKKYGIYSFEDVFDEDDWEGFAKFTKLVGKDTLVVGDDLYVTNPKRIKRGIKKLSTNAVLIKVNQIGTLFETVRAIKMCQDNDLKIIISHRSGETEDSFIADLAVACGADFLKAGSMSRSERLSKYNRLLEIEAIEANSRQD